MEVVVGQESQPSKNGSFSDEGRRTFSKRDTFRVPRDRRQKFARQRGAAETTIKTPGVSDPLLGRVVGHGDCCCWVGGKGVDRTSLGTRGAKRDRLTDLATHSDNITSSETLSESRRKRRQGLWKSLTYGEREDFD